MCADTHFRISCAHRRQPGKLHSFILQCVLEHFSVGVVAAVFLFWIFLQRQIITRCREVEPEGRFDVFLCYLGQRNIALELLNHGANATEQSGVSFRLPGVNS